MQLKNEPDGWIMFNKADFKGGGCVDLCLFHLKCQSQLIKCSLAEKVSIMIPLKFVWNLKMLLWTSKDVIITFIGAPERTAFELLTKSFKGHLLDMSLLSAYRLHGSNMHMILIFLTQHMSVYLLMQWSLQLYNPHTCGKKLL